MYPVIYLLKYSKASQACGTSKKIYLYHKTPAKFRNISRFLSFGHYPSLKNIPFEEIILNCFIAFWTLCWYLPSRPLGQRAHYTFFPFGSESSRYLPLILGRHDCHPHKDEVWSSLRGRKRYLTVRHQLPLFKAPRCHDWQLNGFSKQSWSIKACEIPVRRRRAAAPRTASGSRHPPGWIDMRKGSRDL